MTPDITLDFQEVCQAVPNSLPGQHTSLNGDVTVIHVFGHSNPDSDAICTALVTACWLSGQSRPARAWRLGEANRETQFIFEAAGLCLPERLDIPLKGEDVWLVDFSELSQGPADLLQGNILGIIDHHRLGGISTRMPPEVWIKPVGSSATLLWMIMSAEQRRALTPAHAILLLGAIISDTLNLKSPTTTEDDIRIVTELCVISGVNRKSFARDLLIAKTDIENLSAEQLIDKDLKAFVISGTDVRIAQIEVSSIDDISLILDKLLSAMAYMTEQTGAGLGVLMITDIIKNYSTLYFSGPEHINASSCSVPGMLSRKKQLIPWLDDRIQHEGHTV